MNRPHLRWCDYDNNGDILPDGFKRLKDGTIVITDENEQDIEVIQNEYNFKRKDY